MRKRNRYSNNSYQNDTIRIGDPLEINNNNYCGKCQTTLIGIWCPKCCKYMIGVGKKEKEKNEKVSLYKLISCGVIDITLHLENGTELRMSKEKYDKLIEENR